MRVRSFARTLSILGICVTTGTAAAPAPAVPVSSSTSSLSSVTPSPADHELIWIAWDDTIYRNFDTCISRGRTLAQQYTDIAQYRCLNRYTVNVVPRRYGMMLEVKRT